MQENSSNVRHYIRNTAMRLFTWVGISWIYRLYMKQFGPLVRIIVFHDVHDTAWFEELIGTIVKRYHVISREDFIEKKFVSGRINVLVTFDDGYASWETRVLPILTKYALKGLFFVNSGLLDVGEDSGRTQTFMREQLMIRPRASLTWRGARVLIENGHTVGAHGRYHENLATLSSEALFTELYSDKNRIEAMLGVTVTECAYPFGTPLHVNGVVVNIAEKVGFQRGYTAISRFVRGTETFMVPRVCIESDVSEKTIRHWVEGSYDMFTILKSVCAR